MNHNPREDRRKTTGLPWSEVSRSRTKRIDSEKSSSMTRRLQSSELGTVPCDVTRKECVCFPNSYHLAHLGNRRHSFHHRGEKSFSKGCLKRTTAATFRPASPGDKTDTGNLKPDIHDTSWCRLAMASCPTPQSGTHSITLSSSVVLWGWIGLHEEQCNSGLL